MKFDREKFFAKFREWRGVVLPGQVKGLNFLLDCIEQDKFITRVEWVAYMLATTMHETAFTFLPVHEFGGRNYFINRYGSQTRVGRQLGNDTPEEGALYAGRGDVQLTGETNYEKAEEALRQEYPALIKEFETRTGKTFDLTVGDQPNDKSDPDNAMDPQIAYAIMSYGMRTGMFTGLSLKRFTSAHSFEWVEARRIINGKDKAQKIGQYAVAFNNILIECLITKGKTKKLEPAQLDDAAVIPGDDPPMTTTDSAPLSQAGTTELPSTIPVQDTTSVNVTNGSVEVKTSTAQPEPTKTESVDAPAKEGSTATATKLSIGGIVLPGFIAVAVKSITDLINQGFISASEIGTFVLNLIQENQKWVLLLVVAIVGLLAVKKVCKQITLWFQMWFAADKSKNNVEVNPQ